MLSADEISNDKFLDHFKWTPIEGQDNWYSAGQLGPVYLAPSSLMDNGAWGYMALINDWQFFVLEDSPWIVSYDWLLRSWVATLANTSDNNIIPWYYAWDIEHIIQQAIAFGNLTDNDSYYPPDAHWIYRNALADFDIGTDPYLMSSADNKIGSFILNPNLEGSQLQLSPMTSAVWYNALCDNDEDLTEIFDLTSKYDEIVNTLSDITLSYYNLESDADSETSPIQTPDNYPSTGAEVIWFRAVNLEGCATIGFFNLIIDTVPIACSSASKDTTKTVTEIPKDTYTLTGNKLSYLVADDYTTDIPASAYLILPEKKPKGVVLLWNGTFLSGSSKTTPDINDLSSHINIKDDYIYIQPHKIGIGNGFGKVHQRWQIINSIKSEGGAILQIAYQLASEKYNLTAGTKLDLFQIGFSQGGFDTMVYHMHFQDTTSEAIYKPQSNNYSLKHSFASAGIYSSKVWEESMLTTFDNRCSTSMESSMVVEGDCTTNEVVKKAKYTQHILLAHYLYTFQNFEEQIDNLYRTEITVPFGLGDNFSFMDTIIEKFFTDDGKTEDSEGIPILFNKTVYKNLTNKDSDLYKKLVAFMKKNSVIDVYKEALKENNYPITMTHCKNDLNVFQQHSNELNDLSVPYLTYLPCGNSDTYTNVQSNIMKPFYYHDKSHLNLIKSFKNLLSN